MAMKLSLIRTFWTFLLVLCHWSDADNHHSDLCNKSMDFPTQVHCYNRNSAGEMQLECDDEECEDEDLSLSISESCLLYPTNTVNCTILDPFPADSLVSGSISTCDGAQTISYMNWTLKEDRTSERGVTVKSASLFHTKEDNISSIMLCIKVSLPDTWTIYYVRSDINSIEVLSPPVFDVSMINGSLVVRWDKPVTRTEVPPQCFDYQLYINGQTINKSPDAQRLYDESNADSTLPYKVKLRTKNSEFCLGPQHWSKWSTTFTLGPSTSRPGELNKWLLTSIVLLLPMILLSVLLLFKRHRVDNIIFPAVPQPAEKYKAFLTNPKAFNLLPPPVQSDYAMEHISEVEE